MPRPKLYLKLEERVLAARSYRAKYYAKNRTVINKKRAEKRKLEIETSVAVQRSETTKLIGEPSSKNHRLSRRAGRPKGTKNTSLPGNSKIHDDGDSESSIEAALKDIIGTSSRQRAQALYESFVASKHYGEINETLTAIEVLQERLQKIALTSQQGDIVTERPLFKSIHTVIKVLEDLLMNAMEGTDMSVLAHRGLLLFQVAPDIML